MAFGLISKGIDRLGKEVSMVGNAVRGVAKTLQNDVSGAVNTVDQDVDKDVDKFEQSPLGNNFLGHDLGNLLKTGTHFGGGLVKGASSLATGVVGLGGMAVDLAGGAAQYSSNGQFRNSVNHHVEQFASNVEHDPSAIPDAIGNGISQAWHHDKADFLGEAVGVIGGSILTAGALGAGSVAGEAGTVAAEAGAAGSVAGVAAESGAAASVAAETGSAANVAAETGTAASVAAESGTAASVAAESGTAASVAAESGTAASVAAESGTAASVAAESGTAASVAAESGTAASVAAESGTAASVAAESGTAASVAAETAPAASVAAETAPVAEEGAAPTTAWGRFTTGLKEQNEQMNRGFGQQMQWRQDRLSHEVGQIRNLFGGKSAGAAEPEVAETAPEAAATAPEQTATAAPEVAEAEEAAPTTRFGRFAASMKKQDALLTNQMYSPMMMFM